MDWVEKVVIVTGGASGIGAATARLLLERGARVVVFDSEEPDEDAQESGTTAPLFVPGSVSSQDDVRRLTDTSLTTYGRIDGLVNNAGIMRRHDRMEDWTFDEIHNVITVNLLGVFHTTHAIAPVIARQGGVIVNIASLGAILPVADSPCYAAAKAGILAMTRSMSGAMTTMGIRMNAILPGFVATPMTADSPRRQAARPLAPQDIANGILHVAGDPALEGGFFSVERSGDGVVLARVADPPDRVPLCAVGTGTHA